MEKESRIKILKPNKKTAYFLDALFSTMIKITKYVFLVTSG